MFVFVGVLRGTEMLRICPRDASRLPPSRFGMHVTVWGPDFVRAAFLVRFRFPPARLETGIDDDAVAFQHGLRAVVRLFTEDDDVHEHHLFVEFVPLREFP